MGLLSLIRKKGHYTSGLRFLIKFLFILNGLNSFTLPVTGSRAASKVHIIYMGDRQHNDPDRVTESHHELLASVLGSKEAAMDAMVYSYRHGFSGFAAKLTESQAQKFKGLPGVVDVMPNHFYSLKTTRSWDYLGQSLSSSNNLLHEAKMGDGIIVGLFDSGVWPESEGYNDEGLGPIPARWKGRCISGDQFDAKTHCNRKLIGAKWFADGLLAEYPDLFKNTTDFQSTRDSNGHGTHTSTTAAGSLVHNASYEGGLAGGIARGGAPHARIAMYKVGWETPETVNGGSAADVLKAFDEAIHDGVDVLSLSIGDEVPFYSDVDHRDGIQTGAFHAVAKGIPVVCSAGNDGPAAQTVAETSPWILNVAATTLDRSFPTGITLGNNMTILGQSLFVGKQIGFTSLVHPELPEGFKPISYCETLILSLNFTSVDGKVVLCFAKTSDLSVVSNAEETLQAAGAVGLIVGRNPPVSAITLPLKSTFPSVLVDYELATQILLYIRSTRSPAVKISPAKTLTGKPVATVVAHFSSRGPSSISPAILKPDVAAPGVSIVAGSAPFDEFYYNGFALQTGTSMACPHVAGIVALLRAIHPTWSPAAIKSAIITTASKTDPHGEPIFAETSSKKLATPFDFGGGLVNPDKAAYPGLVYDMAINDYIHYLCAQNYNSSSISMLVGYKITCPQGTLSVLDVNYPAFTIPSLKHSVTVTRTVTNVGPVNSVYKVVIDPPAGYSVIVMPKVLVFNGSTKRASFKVTFTTTHKKNSGYYFGSLTWSDGVHTVASPISVRTQILESFIDDY